MSQPSVFVIWQDLLKSSRISRKFHSRKNGGNYGKFDLCHINYVQLLTWGHHIRNSNPKSCYTASRPFRKISLQRFLLVFRAYSQHSSANGLTVIPGCIPRFMRISRNEIFITFSAVKDPALRALLTSLFHANFIANIATAGCCPLFRRGRYLTRWFPMRQIGAFRPLRRDCTSLRDRRMSWIVSIGRIAVFYYKLKLEHLSNHTYSHYSKKFEPWFFQISRFSDFDSGLRETERS